MIDIEQVVRHKSTPSNERGNSAGYRLIERENRRCISQGGFRRTRFRA